MVTTIFIAIGAMMLPIGFQLWGMYYIVPNASESLKYLGSAGMLIGIVALWEAIRRGKKEDKETKDSRETRDRFLEAIATKIGADIDNHEIKTKGNKSDSKCDK